MHDVESCQAVNSSCGKQTFSFKQTYIARVGKAVPQVVHHSSIVSSFVLHLQFRHINCFDGSNENSNASASILNYFLQGVPDLNDESARNHTSQEISLELLQLKCPCVVNDDLKLSCFKILPFAELV